MSRMTRAAFRIRRGLPVAISRRRLPGPVGPLPGPGPRPAHPLAGASTFIGAHFANLPQSVSSRIHPRRPEQSNGSDRNRRRTIEVSPRASARRDRRGNREFHRVLSRPAPPRRLGLFRRGAQEQLDQLAAAAARLLLVPAAKNLRRAAADVRAVRRRVLDRLRVDRRCDATRGPRGCVAHVRHRLLSDGAQLQRPARQGREHGYVLPDRRRHRGRPAERRNQEADDRAAAHVAVHRDGRVHAREQPVSVFRRFSILRQAPRASAGRRCPSSNVRRSFA